LCSELAIAVDIDWLDCPALIHVVNAGYKGTILGPLLANVNLGRFACHSGIADVDVVTAGSEIDTGISA